MQYNGTSYPSSHLYHLLSASKQAFRSLPSLGFPIQSCSSNSCLFIIIVVCICDPRSANPILRQRIPDIHLRQKLFQSPETSRLSYRANCRQGTGECRYHLAFSVRIREGRDGRSSRRLESGRRSSDGRIVVGSAWGT